MESRRHPRILIRKNTPAETRENWQFVKVRGGRYFRLLLKLLILALLIPFGFAFYSYGYFNGATAVRSEIISKESN